jgi:hypothetical protein
MTNTNKAEKNKAVENDKFANASAEIEAVLVKYNLALQPSLSFSELGIIPRVRLVDNEIEDVDKGTDSKEASGDKEESTTS